eukprot:12301638-Heterocapsa_arctica.AAC.1
MEAVEDAIINEDMLPAVLVDARAVLGGMIAECAAWYIDNGPDQPPDWGVGVLFSDWPPDCQ